MIYCCIHIFIYRIPFVYLHLYILSRILNNKLMKNNLLLLHHDWSTCFPFLQSSHAFSFQRPKALSGVHRGQTHRLQCPVGGSSIPYIQKKTMQG